MVKTLFPLSRPARKILVVKLRAMGDTVLMTAALNEIRETFPRAEVHVLVTDSWASLLENHPGVDRIWPYRRRRDMTARAKTVARLAIQLRREKLDLATNFHAGPSSSTLAFAGGAKVRSVHFHGIKDKNRYSTVTVPGKGEIKPAIERDMDTLRGLGIQVPQGRLPRVFLRETELNEAKTRVTQEAALPVLGISMGASRLTKKWPAERFIEVAKRWITDGGSVAGFAGPGEEEEMTQIAQALPVELKDRFTIYSNLEVRQLASTIAQCGVFLGNDSGPRHLAVGVSTPTVTVIGPEHPHEWHPYPTDLHPYHFIDNLDCRQDAAPGHPAWCGLKECHEFKHRCMTQISVDQVYEQCKRVSV